MNIPVILKVLVSMVPSIVEAAKGGAAAWKEFLEARKVQGDDELNAKLDALGDDFVRLQVLAEYQAQPGTQP